MQKTRHDNSPIDIYVLSHHVPLEYYRCIQMPWRGKKYYVCARCFGVYFGAILGIIASFFWKIDAMLPELLPLPAMIDWTVHILNLWNGNNAIRIVSGVFLGFAYGVLLVYLVTGELFLFVAISGSYVLWFFLVCGVKLHHCCPVKAKEKRPN